MQGRWSQSVTCTNMNSHPLFLNAPVLSCHSLEEWSLRQRRFSFLSYKKTFHGAGSSHCICSPLAASPIFNPIWEWWEACDLPNGILQSGERKREHVPMIFVSGHVGKTFLWIFPKHWVLCCWLIRNCQGKLPSISPPISDPITFLVLVDIFNK